MSSSANSSLRPAWHRGKGFQPPPTVASSHHHHNQQQQRSRSQSIGSNDSSKHHQQNFNKYSILDSDDEDTLAATATGTATTTATTTANNSRSEALRSSISRSASAGHKTSGRSLKELAEQTPDNAVSDRAPGTTNITANTNANTSSSTTTTSTTASGRFSSLRLEDPASAAKVIRYTREKLLSMRPAPSSTLPDCLKPMEGTVVINESPQDPVCWDTFDAEEIWATVPARDRRASTSALPKSADGGSSGSGGIGAAGGLEVRRASTTMIGRNTSGSTKDGRWQRGVALPPPDQSKKRDKRADNPEDLWDDPLSGGAATDFSSFGAMPEDSTSAADDVFDFEKVAEASKRLDEELHGNRSRASSDATGGSQDGQHNARTVKVDPKRPLASAGTTILSGSGDDVNVFEDFDEPDSEAEETTSATTATATSTTTEAPIPIKGADEDPNASSRLMAMIGVVKETAPARTEPVPLPSEKPETNAWGVVPVAGATPAAAAVAAPVPKEPSAIPLNPWGDPILVPPPNPIDIQVQLQQAAEMERKAAEELRRRREMEEAQRRAQQERVASSQGQQQQQQQGAVQSQVELVLMERISTILENSWGQADLVSILSTLHAEDSRVIPLLPTIDGLRALIMRNPTRIALRQDPAFGATMAVLVMTNTQWQQAQQQAQARAQQQQQQQELQRREQQRRLEEQQKQQQQQQQQAMPTIVPGMSWYYSDPQNNIQGPFRSEEMRQWLEAGYFKGTLPISQHPTGPFQPLSLVFKDISRAFWTEDAKAEEDARLQAEAAAAAEREAEAERERLAAAAAAAAAAQEAAERERLAKEAAERERREQEMAAAAASSSSNNGGNQSSAQLKMMLGLSAEKQADAPTDTPIVQAQTSTTVPATTTKKTKAKSKSLPPQQTTKELVASPSGPPAAAVSSPVSSKPTKAVAGAGAPAWGGATKQVQRKSMSEIQQEEARAAAMAAMQREGSRPSSGGWANVAAARSGPAAWSGSGAARPVAATPGVVMAKPQAVPAQRPQAQASPALQQQQQVAGASQPPAAAVRTTSSSSVAEEFGAKMSPAFEKWCKDQMIKLNGSDDITLVSFCMTLQDSSEIRQYLTTYLGSTSQVNSFATEFINRKNGVNGGAGGSGAQEEWETTGTAKKSKKKKSGTR